MLRNLLLITLLTFAGAGVIIPARAEEQKPGLYMAAFWFNDVHVRPGLVKGLMDGCMKHEGNTTELCTAETGKMADQIIAYVTYRITTEKTWDQFKVMVDCSKSMESHPECPALRDYNTQIFKDYATAQQQAATLVKDFQAEKTAK